MIRLNLRVLMAQKRLEQKDVIEGTGINKSTISRYYNDNVKKIDMNHIEILCDYFKCTPNDLFEIIKEPK